jgi:hypothetical protein
VRYVLTSIAWLLLGTAVPLAAVAAPSPAPTRTVSPLFQLATPPPNAYQQHFSGSTCMQAQVALAAANAVNPITGTVSTQLIVLPIGNWRKIPDATARAQLAAACAHGR